jgi:hypothetical protein
MSFRAKSDNALRVSDPLLASLVSASDHERDSARQRRRFHHIRYPVSTDRHQYSTRIAWRPVDLLTPDLQDPHSFCHRRYGVYMRHPIGGGEELLYTSSSNWARCHPSSVTITTTYLRILREMGP